MVTANSQYSRQSHPSALGYDSNKHSNSSGTIVTVVVL